MLLLRGPDRQRGRTSSRRISDGRHSDVAAAISLQSTQTHDYGPASARLLRPHRDHDRCASGARRARAARLPRHPGGCRGKDRPVVLAKAIGRLRPRDPCRLALLERHARLPERRALLHAAPGVEAQRRGSPRARRRSARDGALVVEPAARVSRRPGDRRTTCATSPTTTSRMACPRRRRSGPPAVPVQRGRAQRNIRRRHARGPGAFCSRTRRDRSAPSW